MPYTVSVEEGFALLKAVDRVSPADRSAANEELRERPDFRPGLPLLIDVRGLSEIPPHADMMLIADVHSTMLGGHPVAYLTRPGAQYGVARQLEVVIESVTRVPVSVFTDYDAALEWIRALP